MAFTPLPPKEHQHDYSVETETRLVVPNVATFGPGDIDLEGGIGINPRRRAVDGALVLDAPNVDKDAPAGLYVPDLSTWPATSLRLPGGSSYLMLLEALIAGTTPGAADAANCYEFNIAGSSAGSQGLRLDSDVRAHYWDATELGTIADTGNILGSPSGRPSWAQRIVPGGDITVDALEFVVRTAVYGSHAGQQWRAVILNSNMTSELGASPYDTDGWSEDVWRTFTLSESVDLTGGVAYWIAFECANTSLRTQPREGNTGPHSGITFTASQDGGKKAIPYGSADNTFVNHASLETDTSGGPEPMASRLLGAPGGVLLTGDTIDLSAIVNGVPPAVPSQVNVRLQWAAEAA